MSSRDSFFEKVLQNNEATNKFKDSFNRDLEEFQRKTQELLVQIQSWFEGTAITATTSRKSIDDSIEPGKLNTVLSLLLKNGEKTLSIDPEGLHFSGGVTGSLTVKIVNMTRAPNTQNFNLHMRDSDGMSKGFEGWVIVSGNHASRVIVEFTEENFFAKIESFA
ncbi:hypothetical protein [Serratia fonticola]|uniref:Uncharacterized protein n=1 Tax=Serratia fonticola TaxID=47917 RepID=A0AAW3WJ36_SERFO|nr:hypothetical protein [Serratia fonticola]ALX95969.1 hypothetical protein AV650_21575 [Serratia fonticola]MBC3210696.1 hypothetical protein [Serratia fonticola]NYA11678.1 hypothetical protein [Serratia fonticola]NYA32760.1 hypothetical protein [Serratia fonticola]